MKQKPLARLRNTRKGREDILKTALFGIVVTFIVFLPATSHAQEWTGNVNALLGVKALDKEDWEPVEDHTEFGILIDFKKETWPVSIAIDLLQSEADDTLVDPLFGLVASMNGETTELNLGVRKIWDQNAKARPYIGGGLALISADASAQIFGINISEDDDAEGLWINAGVYWTLGESFNIGLDLRYSQAEVTLVGFDTEAGGGHAGFVLGFHW